MSSEWLKEKSKLVICELQQIIEKEKSTKKAFVRGDYRQCAENTLALLGSAFSNFFITNLALLPAPDGQSVILLKNVHVVRSNVLRREFVKKLHRINLFIALFYVLA